ncbi:MAG: hypothetical protein ACOH2O_13435 [Pseudomonas sp.]
MNQSIAVMLGRNVQPGVAFALGRMYGEPVVTLLAIGFSGPTNSRHKSASITIAGAFFMPAPLVYGGCAWEIFGSAGFLDSRSANPRTAATLIRLAANRGSSSNQGALPMQFSRTPNSSVTSGKAAAHRAMAIAALHADSSLSVRLKRYNAHMEQARAHDAVGGVQ